MKTFAILLLLMALALPALAAAPIGTRTSQSIVFSSAVDAFSYRVSSLVSLQRTAQGLLVTTTPGQPLFHIAASRTREQRWFLGVVHHPPERDRRVLLMIRAMLVLMAVLFAVPAFGADLTARADQLLGIAYRPDGVRDESGRWTQFEHSEQTFSTPGLNCSGLDFTLMRLIAPLSVTIRQAARDRLGDSGPNAPMGQDWDFGFDLILNLSDGLPRRWLTPEPRPVTGQENGRTELGFLVADQAAWSKALALIGPNQVCLVSFSQTGRRKGYTLQHYHVGVILPGSSGGRWLYQATPKSGVHKLNLAEPAGMNRFLAFFSGGDKRALLLAVDLSSR